MDQCLHFAVFARNVMTTLLRYGIFEAVDTIDKTINNLVRIF